MHTPPSTTPGRSSPLRRVTLDHLWIATMLALTTLFIAVLPLPPNDLWWHMAAGRTMIETRSLVTTNMWAFTRPADAPYVFQSWLSEIIMFLLWQIGDVPFLTLARTLVIVGTLGLVAWHAYRRTGNGRAVALAVFAVVMMSHNNWTFRPQTLALVPAALTLVILGEVLDGRARLRWLAALPVIMLVWVNMHGSFILGGVVLGLAALATLASSLRHNASWQTTRALFLTLATTLGAMLINPLGLGIVTYLRMMLGNNALQDYFVEWQPTTVDLNLGGTGFWFFATVFALAALMALGPQRPRLVDVLWYVALGWLALGGFRYVMWFALATLPLLASQLAPLLGKPTTRPAAPFFTLAYGGLIAAAVIATLPWFGPGRYLNAPQLFAREGQYRWLLSNTTPIGATNWLVQHPIEGRFWTDMSYSSYTIWQIPTKQVFADLRVELFPIQIWDEYFAISAGGQQGMQLLDTYHITHLLIDTTTQADLRAALLSRPGWCEVYHDGEAAILRRCP